MKARVLIMAAAAAVILSGCGSLNWKSEYSCPGMPDGVVCKSPTEVYKLTENADRLTRDENGAPSNKAQLAAASDGAIKHIPGQVSTGRNMPRDALPVLEPAKVMRVWIAPWIDNKQDLHMPGYVFTEVTPRRWSFGESSAVRGKPLVPLQLDMKDRADEDGVEVGDEAKLLTPKGLVQGMQQQQMGRGGAFGQIPMGQQPGNGLGAFGAQQPGGFNNPMQGGQGGFPQGLQQGFGSGY